MDKRYGPKPNRRKPIEGLRFGRLVVTKRIDADKHECLCDCGNTVEVARQNLRSGDIKSCGCFRRESVAKLRRKPNSKALSIGRYYRRNAIVRGLCWDIQDSFEQILEKSCSYCGLTPALGIDRPDNSLGYIQSNAVPCCKRCNQAKNTMTVDEFIDWVVRVYTYSKKEVV